jgi:hypothetical protein
MKIPYKLHEYNNIKGVAKTLSAIYIEKDTRLVIHRGKELILDESGVDEDYWTTVEVDDVVYDINIHNPIANEWFLSMYGLMRVGACYQIDTKTEASITLKVEVAHHEDCPAIDGFGCHCDELEEDEPIEEFAVNPDLKRDIVKVWNHAEEAYTSLKELSDEDILSNLDVIKNRVWQIRDLLGKYVSNKDIENIN